MLLLLLLSPTDGTAETDDSDLKVADFGFAKRIKDLLPKETACGTPGYVAPEILRGDRYGAEVDIWSMGVICYVLLAGYPPFYDEDQKRLFKKIKEGRYHFHEDYWSNTSREAINMIQMMLCVDQSKRWTAEQLLHHPWISMGNESLEAKDLTNSITVMRKFNARRRLRAAADAVIIANRMRAWSQSGKKQPPVTKQQSLLDPEALVAASVPEEPEEPEEHADKRRQSFESEIYGDAPSINPVLDLMNDKELEQY